MGLDTEWSDSCGESSNIITTISSLSSVIKIMEKKRGKNIFLLQEFCKIL
jgi:uncharacterized protein with PQ loop repeat